MKKYHQKTNATVEIRTTTHLMVTATQVILYTDTLPHTPLI